MFRIVGLWDLGSENWILKWFCPILPGAANSQMPYSSRAEAQHQQAVGRRDPAMWQQWQQQSAVAGSAGGAGQPENQQPAPEEFHDIYRMLEGQQAAQAYGTQVEEFNDIPMFPPFSE